MLEELSTIVVLVEVGSLDDDEGGGGVDVDEGGGGGDEEEDDEVGFVEVDEVFVDVFVEEVLMEEVLVSLRSLSRPSRAPYEYSKVVHLCRTAWM